MSFMMYVPTRIVFGQGAAKSLGRQKLPGKKALIVISNGKSTRENGYLELIENQLKDSGIESVIFDKIQPNPLKATVEEGGRFARDNNCDFIIALGGGSVMDASKAIATAAANEGDLWDYAFGKTGKGMPIQNTPLPIVAVTTTAGTGSEVDQWGVITKPETNEKIGFGGIDELYPKLAIVDPELMKSVAPKFTAYQGFDALFHSTECYIAKTSNFMSDMYALESIRNISKYLARAVADGSDIEAREHIAFANTLSGVVMTISSCTSEHSIEHAMSAYHQNLTHGAGLIMISRAYYQHFVDCHACDEKFIAMAKAMGIENAADAQDFITALCNLQKACGVDNLSMAEAGIAKDELETIAANARETMGGLFSADPAPLSHGDCVKILEKSYR